MIKEGQFTIIDGKTYQVVRIDEAFAYLHNVETYKGRPRKMLLSRVPYFDESGTLIEPKQEETKIPTRKFQSKVNVREIVKSETEMQVSKKAIMFLQEQLSSICEILICNAEQTAERHGHSRIGPEHICYLNLPDLHHEVLIDHKEYIEDGMG